MTEFTEFEVGDRILYRLQSAPNTVLRGVVEACKHNSVLVKWSDGSGGWIDANRLEMDTSAEDGFTRHLERLVSDALLEGALDG